jgi:hypothetical protein
MVRYLRIISHYGTGKDLGYLRHCPGWLVSRVGGTIENMIGGRGIAENRPARDGPNPEHGSRSRCFKVGRGRIPGVLARKKQLLRFGAYGERWWRHG